PWRSIFVVRLASPDQDLGGATTSSAIPGYNRRAERIDAMPARDPTAEVYIANIAPRKQTHKPDLGVRCSGLLTAERQGALSSYGPPKFGARGKLHLKSGPPSQHRLDPNAAAVHLNDLLGDGKA